MTFDWLKQPPLSFVCFIHRPGGLKGAELRPLDLRACAFICFAYRLRLHVVETTTFRPAPKAIRIYCRELVTGRNQVQISIWPDICHRNCVHYSKLLKGMECTVVSMVLCITKEPLKSFEIRIGLPASFCRDIASMCRKRRKAIYIHITTLKVAIRFQWYLSIIL